MSNRQAQNESGSDRAKRDWDEQKAGWLLDHELLCEHALIHENGLYIRFGPSADYCVAYNNEVQRLLQEHGPPWWLPGARLPTENEAIRTLMRGSEYSAYEPSGVKESRVVRLLEDRWKTVHGILPVHAARIGETGILLIGGPVEGGYRIDVIDVTPGVWMHSYRPAPPDEANRTG